MKIFEKRDIDIAIRDMNSLITNLIAALKEAKIDNKTRIIVNRVPLQLNDAPQDFFLIQYDSKVVLVQMLKPTFRPCFYFIKEDVHIFTDMIQEVMSFFKEAINT